MLETESDMLSEILLEDGLITREQLEEAREEHARTGDPLAKSLVAFQFVSENDMLEAVARRLGTRVVQISDLEIPIPVLKSVPSSVARMYSAVPVEADDQSVTVAVLDPLNPQVVDELAFVIGKDVNVVLAPQAQLEEAIVRYYGDDSESVAELLEELEASLESTLESEERTDVEALQEMASQTPIIRFVNLVLYQAVQDRASDIHFEPFEDEFKIRYRVDGALYEMAPPPRQLALPVTSRIKVMANLNIAERRLPQDGRIRVQIAGRAIDLRVSTLPTQFGESVVLRVLDRAVVDLDLENLGMPREIYDEVCELIEHPHGIIIVTGPTGCGKTTTLYSALKRINRIGSKLLTTEDPVEYDIEGIMQVPIKEEIGLTFARCLRSFLRQDPDIIMVGEVRDLDTAQIAIQASLTGHLVLSTLHTNDAPGAITRLIDMGTEPFLISSTLEAVVGQRLLRRICSNCRVEYDPEPSLVKMLNLPASQLEGKTFFYGRGCQECNDTGYRGRVGIFELLHVSHDIRDLINEKAPTAVIRRKAVEQGMRTMRNDGVGKMFDGVTTIDEVLKYT